MKIEVWHNILWSRYKAVVFSELYRISHKNNVEFTVYQIAETDVDRIMLSEVDLSLHQYPYVNIFKGPYSGIPLARRVRQLLAYALKSDADLTILAGFEKPEYWAQLLALVFRRRKRAVFCESTLNDNEYNRLKAIAKRVFFGLCDGAFCYGVRSKEYLVHYGMPESRIFVRREAVALADDYDASVIPQSRAARATAEPVFLYIGRLAPEKRIGTLLKACAEALREMPAARLRIVGGGAQEAELKALAASLGIAPAVDFVGPLSGRALWDEYLSATCCVLPSHSEPWGLVVNEALHCGCPVVVSDRCGCVPELVENSDCGQVFPCDDVAALARALLAAPRLYADRAAVAERCLRRIAPFSPRAAAEAILAGVEALQPRTAG